MLPLGYRSRNPVIVKEVGIKFFLQIFRRIEILHETTIMFIKTFMIFDLFLFEPGNFLIFSNV